VELRRPADSGGPGRGGGRDQGQKREGEKGIPSPASPWTEVARGGVPTAGSGRRQSRGRWRRWGLGKGARGGEGGGGGRELREGPIYRPGKAVEGWPRRWPVRGAINGASAACPRRDAACGEGVGVEASSSTWGRGCASTGRRCERRGRVAAVAGGSACSAATRGGGARARTAWRGAGPGQGAGDGQHGAVHSHALRVRRGTARARLARGVDRAGARPGAGARCARVCTCATQAGLARSRHARVHEGRRVGRHGPEAGDRVVLGSRGRGEEKGGEGRREKKKGEKEMEKEKGEKRRRRKKMGK
jgi:hypothetical protein